MVRSKRWWAGAWWVSNPYLCRCNSSRLSLQAPVHVHGAQSRSSGGSVKNVRTIACGFVPFKCVHCLEVVFKCIHFLPLQVRPVSIFFEPGTVYGTREGFASGLVVASKDRANYFTKSTVWKSGVVYGVGMLPRILAFCSELFLVEICHFLLQISLFAFRFFKFLATMMSITKEWDVEIRKGWSEVCNGVSVDEGARAQAGKGTVKKQVHDIISFFLIILTLSINAIYLTIIDWVCWKGFSVQEIVDVSHGYSPFLIFTRDCCNNFLGVFVTEIVAFFKYCVLIVRNQLFAPVLNVCSLSTLRDLAWWTRWWQACWTRAMVKPATSFLICLGLMAGLLAMQCSKLQQESLKKKWFGVLLFWCFVFGMFYWICLEDFRLGSWVSSFFSGWN